MMKSIQAHILVAEDSPTQAERLQQLLESTGYEVAVVSNGQQALMYLEQHSPSLILSDILMPEMDGYQLCRTLKSNPQWCDIPVILLTTLSEPEDIVKGLECGADNFILKPYEDENLLNRIEYALLNRRMKDQSRARMGLEINLYGKNYHLASDRLQILNLLLATYESALQKSRELEKANRELREATETIRTLKKLIPICAGCKKIRDDLGYWHQLESFLHTHADFNFTHGLCPTCAQKTVKELEAFKRSRNNGQD